MLCSCLISKKVFCVLESRRSVTSVKSSTSFIFVLVEVSVLSGPNYDFDKIAEVFGSIFGKLFDFF